MSDHLTKDDVRDIVRDEVEAVVQIERAPGLTETEVRALARDEFSAKIRYARALMYAFTAGLTIVVLVGFIGGKDLLQRLHNEAFPPHLTDQVAVSYESSLELKAMDPRLQSRSISFWATERNRVFVYVRGRQTSRSMAEDRKIIITVDGHPIDDAKTLNDIAGGFHPITHFLNRVTNISRPPVVHELVVSLDDAQIPDMKAEVTLSVVILVRGAE